MKTLLCCDNKTRAFLIFCRTIGFKMGREMSSLLRREDNAISNEKNIT